MQTKQIEIASNGHFDESVYLIFWIGLSGAGQWGENNHKTTVTISYCKSYENDGFIFCEDKAGQISFAVSSHVDTGHVL